LQWNLIDQKFMKGKSMKVKTQNQFMRGTIDLLLIAGALLPLASSAAEHREGHRGQFQSHEFRESEFRDRGFLDSRFNHDHYYPSLGYRFSALPPEHHGVIFGGTRYFFAAGIWYTFFAGAYVVVAPPIGVTLPVLPPYYTTVWVAGMPYYYSNRVYYFQSPQGYVVVPEPVGTVTTVPPVNAHAPIGNQVIEHGPVSASPPPMGNADVTAQLFIYPRQGQTAEQQAKDRTECHDWSIKQIGGDPSTPNAGSPSNRSSDYSRANGACLDARGYTVR
jgi:hypothetical protein